MDSAKLYADLLAVIDEDLKNRRVVFPEYGPTEVRLLAHAMTNNVAEPEKPVDIGEITTRIKEVLAIPYEDYVRTIPVPRETMDALKRDLSAEMDRELALACLGHNSPGRVLVIEDSIENRLRHEYRLHFPDPLEIFVRDESHHIKKRRVVQPTHPPKSHGKVKWPSNNKRRRRRK